jgi:putative DNA primase/helicase
MKPIERVTQELMIPPPLEVNFSAIPEVLKSRSQWVGWTYKLIDGEIKKPPIDLHTGRQASVTRPQTWGSFIDAQRAYETGQISGKPVTLAGVGFVLTHGIVGIDIDHCIQNGTISDDTSLLVAALQTYTEYSPSTDINGLPTGLHLWLEKVSLPGRFRRKENVEMYQDARYLTVTGQSVQDPPLPLSKDQNALDAIYQHIFTPKIQENTGVVVTHRAERRSHIYWTDEEVLEKAYHAKNGENFKRHFEGDYSLWEGAGARHQSHSNADFELVLMLLYWTNKDPNQVDRLFRQSGLMREKWDRKIKGNETYGERIIKDAINNGNR